MNPTQLNTIIKRFHKNQNYSDIYKLGLCSELAVALKRYLHGGTIYKHGLWHTVLYYKGKYCDINGCQSSSQLMHNSPIGLTKSNLRAATPSELAHIKKLLDNKVVSQIVSGLKGADNQ